MRGGPSTGIPAKSEQSDLSFAVSGLHGDAPRLVLAPTSIADCLATTQWAVQLAEALQAPAIVLSDQFMGQSRAIIDRPPTTGFIARTRLTAAAEHARLQALSRHESGVSPMAIPGTPGIVYTADGLEHTEAGIPSSQSRDHGMQLDKRERKLAAARLRRRVGRHRGRRRSGGDHFRLGAPARCARPLRAPRATASRLRLIALRLLAPLQPERLAAALAGVDTGDRGRAEPRRPAAPLPARACTTCRVDRRASTVPGRCRCGRASYRDAIANGARRRALPRRSEAGMNA